MQPIESYLDSVRKSLDVRTDAERDAIIAEIRDHVLESAARFESEGLDHQAAVERAIQQAGDNRAVAASISEVHDGASWRQAWVAAIPVAVAFLSSALSARFFRTTEGSWPIVAAELFALLTAYRILSSREAGHRWRAHWLAVMLGAGSVIIRAFGYWLLLPPEARIAAFRGAMDVSSQWWPVVHDWGMVVNIGLVVGAVAILLPKGRRLTWAGVASAPFVIYLAAHFGVPHWFQTLNDHYPRWSLLYFAFAVYFWPAFYIFFVKRWRCDWAFLWSFGFTLLMLMPSGYNILAYYWHTVANKGGVALLVAATAMAYVTLPRKFAMPVFLAGVLGMPAVESASWSWSWPGAFALRDWRDAFLLAAILLVFRLFVFLAGRKLKLAFSMRLVERNQEGLQ